MLTLILPGYSPKNITWANETKSKLQLPDAITVCEWDHWEKNLSFDINKEAKKLLVNIGTQKVNIIAKSIGTKVLLKVIPKIQKQINKIILCGININPIEHIVSLKHINYKNILIIQNSQDPVMPFKIIEKYFYLINPKINVIEKISATHDYPYYDVFQNFLS